MKKLFVLFALLFTAAFAQDGQQSVQAQSISAHDAEKSVVISPQAIVVNPQPEFDVEVSVDKDPSGNSIPTYNIGERIVVTVRTSADAYVYLYNVRSNGEITQFMPNSYDSAGSDNYVRAGQARTFPPANARYNLQVDGPSGTDKIIALASKTELDVRQLANIASDGFATSNAGQNSFAQTLSIIVTPLPQANWVTDTVLFNVGNAPAPQIGAINISSNPSGSAVYIDNRFSGYTPLSVRAATGTHTIRVEQPGYQSFQQSVTVVAGRTINVNANLSGSAPPVNRQGTAIFDSYPAGAQVYVNNSLVGTTPTGILGFAPGTYTARFSLPGYSEQATSFTVSPSHNTEVTVTLASIPQEGSLLIRSNSGNTARVFVNGTEYGAISSGVARIDNLPAGRHQIVVLAPGYSAFVSEFTITAGSATNLTVTLTRR